MSEITEILNGLGDAERDSLLEHLVSDKEKAAQRRRAQEIAERNAAATAQQQEQYAEQVARTLAPVEFLMDEVAEALGRQPTASDLFFLLCVFVTGQRTGSGTPKALQPRHRLLTLASYLGMGADHDSR